MEEVKVLQVKVLQCRYERMGTVVSIAEAGKVFRQRGRMLARMSMRVGDAVWADDDVWADDAVWMDDEARELQVWLAAGKAVGWEVMVEVTDYEG